MKLDVIISKQCTALIDKSVRRHIQSKSEKFSEYFDLDNTFYNSLVSRGVLTSNETDDIKVISKIEKC